MNTSNLRHSLSRDQVLVAHAAEMIARTSLSQDDFAEELSKQIHLSIPDKARAKDVPDFTALSATSDTSAFLKASGSWLRKVNRRLKREKYDPSQASQPPQWLEHEPMHELRGHGQADQS